MTERDRLIREVSRMVKSLYGNDWLKAFDAFDKDRDGCLNGDEVNDVLRYSGVGNFLSRSAFVRAVMRELDADENGLISRKEFIAVFQPTQVSES